MDLPAPVIDPCGPYPTEPMEPQEVVLHEAERILVLIGANDGSGDAYLVPGYRMRGGDEWVVDVPAVDDESLLPTTPVDARRRRRAASSPPRSERAAPSRPTEPSSSARSVGEG